MPKISYLHSDDNGTDTTEVTQAVIEQKIANIEALLHGLVDEDNLLTYREGTDPLRINPGVISDFPTEFKPVNHGMKFFANGGQEEGIVDKMWKPLIAVAETNPAFHTIGGIQDGELIWEFSKETKYPFGEEFHNFFSIDFEDSVPKNKTIEVPPNFVPMTWADLYEYLSDEELKLVALQRSDGIQFVAKGKFDSVEDFANQMGSLPEEIVEFVSVSRNGTQLKQSNTVISTTIVTPKKMPKIEFFDERNEATWISDIDIKHYAIDSNIFVVVRMIVEALFKVLP